MSTLPSVFVSHGAPTFAVDPLYEFRVGGIRHGVLAMESYVFGQRVALELEEPVHA